MLEPVAYPAEAALHDLVQEAPQMLPLAGSPRLTVLGREVRLGTGSADLLAVESTGRRAVRCSPLSRPPDMRMRLTRRSSGRAGPQPGRRQLPPGHRARLGS